MRTFLILATCLLALAVAQPAGAIVPPKDCGTTTVKHKRYDIKADQMRCKKAKKYSRAFLRSKDKPRGYRCKSYKASQTKLRFRCERGVKVFFAIRH
ncbi:MAG TPA: hypothetical protein VF533_05720 [Solirubrobacteraceae bacterium]